ncbi:MAG: RNA-binding protein [Oceanospirillum sp.]|nr:RNA-binding protein [Oceanospirillum sp.]
MAEQTEKVRLDKWLWAARFFKTRALAKKAIEGGKVEYNGERCKSSKMAEVGAMITVPQGWDKKVVKITDVSDQRRGAPEATKLYQETDDSVKKREAEAERRKLIRAAQEAPDRRPDKKSRRQIHRFKRIDSNAE